MRRLALFVLVIVLASCPQSSSPDPPAGGIDGSAAGTAAARPATGAETPPATGEPSAHAPSVGTGNGSAPSMPSQPAARPEITIEEVMAGNPVVVRGHARTFENSVSLRLRDADGALLTETFTTSTGEMGTHNPYEARLWVVRDPGSSMTVEAFEYSARDGSVHSLARRTVSYEVDAIAVTLLFPVGDCTNLKTFSRSIPKSQGMARLLVEALVAGPTAAEKARGASSPFPRGSAINRVALEGGELVVDFNDRLRNVGGACAATAIRESTERTLRQLPSVRSIAISAGGSRELALQP